MARFLRLSNGIPRSFDESGTVTIYDQLYTVPGGGITAGVNVTLPSSGTYTSDELEVYLNGQRLREGADYSYIGSPPRTQVAFTFNLLATEQVRFRVDRSP